MSCATPHGTFTFPTMLAYETQRPNNYTIREGNPYVEYNNTEAGLFIQDDYRFKKNLLLSFGGRYETQSLIDDKMNFAPRAGMTWSPFKSNKTTIRAGAGIFYDWYETSIYENTIRQDGFHQYDTIIRNPGYPNPYDGGNVVVANPSIVQVGTDLNMPTVRRYSLGVEQQVLGWLRMRANYFNQYGWNQFRSRNINDPVLGVRPDATLGNITYLETTGEADSQGLDVNFNFNYQPRRLFGVFGYTIGERNNYTDGALTLPVNSNDLEAEWGPASDDIRHRIFGFFNTELFWGLRAGINYRALSGPAVQHHDRFRHQPGRRHQRASGGLRPQRRPPAVAEQHRPASQLEPWFRSLASARQVPVAWVAAAPWSCAAVPAAVAVAAA